MSPRLRSCLAVSGWQARDMVAIYTVRRMKDGRQFYNTVALEETTPAVSPGDTPASGERATPAYVEVNGYLRQPYQRVKPETVSKLGWLLG
jgi:hypothetical protein